MTIYFYYTYFLLFGTCTYSKFMSIWINMGSIIILQFWFWDNWMLSAKSKVDNFLLLYVQKTKYMFLGLVIQSCPILCDPMNCSPLGSSVHGILQARMLEWVAIPSSRGSSWPRDWTCVSCVGKLILHCWATREAHSHTKFVILCVIIQV